MTVPSRDFQKKNITGVAPKAKFLTTKLDVCNDKTTCLAFFLTVAQYVIPYLANVQK